MATTDEVFKIRFMAEGDAAIKKAQAELERLEKVVGRAVEKFRSGALDQHRFAKASEVLGRQVADARNSLEAYQRAAGRGGGGTRNIGMAALEAGRALEDLNYGLVGVMNNIPQLAMALGAGAGLTGTIAALGAAVLFLSRNWDTIATSLKLGIPNDTIDSFAKARGELEKINAQLDAIASKPRISIAEKIEAGTLKIRREDLERQVAGSQAIDDVFGGQSDREQEVAKAVGDVIRNSGMERRDLTSLVARGAGGNDKGKKLLGDALLGDEFSAKELARVLESAEGGGARGAELARSLRAGLKGDLDYVPAAMQVGPTRREMEEGLKRQAEVDALADEADRALGEARKISVADAFAGIIGVEGRVDQGLRDKVAENVAAGMTAGDARAAAGGAVADNLARELRESGGLPEEWAREEAAKFVRERGKALRAQASGEALSPAAMELERLGLMRSQLGFAEMMGRSPRAPDVLAAESLNQSVQASGAKSLADLQEEQIGKLETFIKLQQDIKRVLERGGLLGA